MAVNLSGLFVCVPDDMLRRWDGSTRGVVFALNFAACFHLLPPIGTPGRNRHNTFDVTLSCSCEADTTSVNISVLQ